MKGAIIGDIIGSRFEKHNCKSKEFELFTTGSHFTDDSVLTIAIAEAILKNEPYDQYVRKYALRYPFAGYGSMFKKWMFGLTKGPYNSWGNGAAMRVSPVAYAFDNRPRVLEEAEKSASFTHNHPEGIKGAQAIALAVYLARNQHSKTAIKQELEEIFGYDLDRSIETIRPQYSFDTSSQGSVPEAVICFLESTGFEDAIRNAISIGGDSDTIAAMAGAIAEAFYKQIPEEIEAKAMKLLPRRFIQIIDSFHAKFID